MNKLRTMMCALLLGCETTETGNPIDRAGEEAHNEGCAVARSSALALDAPSELGFSANDVVAYAGGTHRLELRWGILRFGGYSPRQDADTLTLGVAPRSAKLVEYTNEGGAEIDLGCGKLLEIEVDLTLQSDGGALNEKVRSKLVAERVEVASLHSRFDPARLKGTLTVSPPPPEQGGAGWMTTGVTLEALFTRYGVNGSLSPLFEMHSGDSVSMSAGSGNLASFGAGSCEYGVAVPKHATGEASSAAIFARVAQPGNVSFNGSQATLAFQLADTVCWHFDAGTDPLGRGVSLFGSLAVKTADGAIDGSWPVHVIGRPDANGQLTDSVEVKLQSDQIVDTSQGYLESLGFRGVDVTGYDRTQATVALRAHGFNWSGSVALYGFKDADCPDPKPDDNASPGCPGAARTELQSFTVR